MIELLLKSNLKKHADTNRHNNLTILKNKHSFVFDTFSEEKNCWLVDIKSEIIIRVHYECS